MFIEKHISLQVKFKAYKTMTMPCMLYGSESWNCSRRDFKKFNGLQYTELRSVYGKKWSAKS
jgi:hypothetical protein